MSIVTLRQRTGILALSGLFSCVILSPHAAFCAEATNASPPRTQTAAAKGSSPKPAGITWETIVEKFKKEFRNSLPGYLLGSGKKKPGGDPSSGEGGEFWYTYETKTAEKGLPRSRWTQLSRWVVNNVGYRPGDPQVPMSPPADYSPGNPSLRGAKPVATFAAPPIEEPAKPGTLKPLPRKKHPKTRPEKEKEESKTELAKNFIPQTQSFTLKDPSKTLVNEAANSLKLGDLKDALDTADRALAMNSANAAAYIVKAGAFLGLKNFSEAQSAAGKAARLDARNPEGWRLLGSAQLKMKQYERAKRSLSYAIKLKPKDFLAYEERAKVHRELGDKEAWKADREKAAELDRASAAGIDAELEARKRLNRNLLLVMMGAALVTLLSMLRAVFARPQPPEKPRIEPLLPTAPHVPDRPELQPRTRPAGRTQPLPGVQPPPADELIAGKYRRIRSLDSGATIWLARHGKSQQSFVLKPLRCGGAAPTREELDGARERMSQVFAIEHPAIVRVLDLLADQTPPLLVQEYVLDDTLEQFLANYKQLGAAAARDLLLPVCAALTHGHNSGVLHLNLKPSNIFVSGAGETRIADHLLFKPGTRPGGGCTAPELSQGLATPRSDIYSLGACLRDILREGPGMTPAAAALVAKAMGAAPENRHATVPEFQTDLQNLL